MVAGIRTPQQVSLVGSRRWAELAQVGEEERRTKYPSLEELMPDLYRQLLQAETTLENHFKDMQDLEFTIQEGKLWMLQTRNGKRTGAAMVRIAMEMVQQGMIDEKTALQRVAPDRLNEPAAPDVRPAGAGGRRGHRHAACRPARAPPSGRSSSTPTRPTPGPSRARR